MEIIYTFISLLFKGSSRNSMEVCIYDKSKLLVQRYFEVRGMINRRWFRKKQVYLFLKKHCYYLQPSLPLRLGKNLEEAGQVDYQIFIHFFLFNRNQISLSVSTVQLKHFSRLACISGWLHDIFSWWNNLKNLLDLTFLFTLPFFLFLPTEVGSAAKGNSQPESSPQGGWGTKLQS